MEIQQKYAVISGQLLRYFVTPGTKSPVLFLHGWRSDAKVWQHIMEKLTALGYPCYALDLPGFGQSEAPKTTFSVADFAALITAFAQKTELHHTTVIGHSFGGRVTIKLAAQKPNWIQHIVLVDSGGIRNPSWSRSAKQFAAKIVKPLFTLPGTENVRKKIYEHMGAEDYVATPNLTQTYIKVVQEDLQHDLGIITIPTLLLWGDSDTATPIEDAHRMHELIPHSELHILQNAGHYSFLDQPEQFCNTLIQFLGSH